jgi:hypothetical protein
MLDRGRMKKFSSVGRQWLTLVILATQEAEIKRIEVQSQPRQTVHETRPYLKNTQHKTGPEEWLKW